MSGLIGFHRIAALRGDGLHPKLLALAEERAALADGDPKLADLDAMRGGGFAQAGPNPAPRADGFVCGNVIDFKPAQAASTAADRKTSSL